MNEENAKLAKVQKSCKAAKIVSKILLIFAIVGCTIAIVTGIVFFFGRDKFDPQILSGSGEVKINQQLRIGGVVFAEFNDGEFTIPESMKMTSSVPALQQFFDENGNSPSLYISFYLIFVGIMVAIVAVVLAILSSVFDIILKEGNPFADKAIKRILISMIILCGVLALTTGGGFALLGAFLTWVIYTILDYGRVLKKQSDETL